MTNHAAHERDLFTVICAVVCLVSLLFIGSAVAAIVLGGFEHLG